MRTKAKKFSHKLLALLLAVVMALTCFTGVISAYGATQGRYDDDVEYNSLAWSVLSDEQVATALLDYADEMLPALKELEPTLAAAANSASLDPLEIEWDLNSRQVNLKIIGISLTSVTVKLGSVDELIETINSVDSLIKGSLIDVATTFGVDLGILPDLDLSALNGMSRSNTSSCDIVRGVLGLLYDNNDVIFGNILRGTFTLGVIPLDIYDLLGGMLGITADEARADFAYNILQSVLFNYTDWFTPEEITNYKSGTTPFVFDDVLMEKMATELMDQINVLVTYPDGTSSATRLEAIEAKMEKESLSYEQAASALGYDPNIVYSTERGFEGNVLLFVYGDQKLQLSSADSLFSLGYKALGIAWNTVLKDTIKLIHVNYNVDRGHGSNFDNTYYYWYIENVGAWNDDDLATMYSSENVMAWANAVYADYEATSAEEFLGWVKDNLVHDRTVAEDAAGNWSDIDSTTLFNKLRYSPLADYYFDIQTGPINLYLRQTGTDNLDAFFETNYSGYSSLIAGLNDCLIAAVKDLFPESDNIYVETAGDTARPTMTTTGNFATIDDSAVRTITSTLVGNTLKMVQYVADTTDQNILNGFYLNNDEGTALAESNLEEAMIPLLIACIGNVNLGSGRLDEIIHPADWDACKDAEAVAFVCLREYLSYILPNKDYNVLVSKAADGSINATLEGTILPMARDAVTYVMEGYVPVTDSSGNAWSVKDREVNDENTLLELLNSVVCYYADKYSYEKVDGNAMAIAPLLGVCDQNGNSEVNSGNDIWTNFNNIANDLLPVLGTLQGKGEANFDSEDLIWNDVVLGVLDIDNTDVHASGFCGVSNFIYRLLTIFSSDLIQTNRIVDTAYELVKELFNGLFGPRYNGQIWYPVPDAASTHPFDDLLHKETLGGTGPDNVGAVQKLVNNFIEFSGFGGSGVATYPDTLLPGLVFVLTAVNSFVKILPDIADHSLSMASVDVANPTFTACSASSSNYSSITFTNNSKGVNIAYVDGMADTNVQLSRYYLKINSAVIEKPDGSTGGSSIAAPSSGLIAPGESVSLNTTTVFSPDAGSNSCTYAIVVNYDITDKDGTVLHENLESRTYQYLTSDVSWAETVYPESRIENGLNRFPESLESNSANETKTVNGFSVFTTQQFGDTGSNNRFIVNYPEYITLETGNLSAIDSYAVRVRNIKVGGLFGAAKTLYGFYFYDEATVRDDRTGSSVSVNSANAIPVFDKQTGDLLRIGLYDYSTDGGSSWTNGVDQSTLESAQNQFYQQNPDKTEDFVSRTHVAFTLDDAYNKGLIAAAHKNDRGLYDYVYMKDPGGDNGYHNVLLQISMRGPIDGFYLNTDSNPSIGNNASVYQRFLQYDGTTAVQGTTEPIESKICFWHNKASTTATLKFVVADTTVNDSVSDKIDEMTDVLNNYKDSDFDSPETITVAEEAISNALAVSATPITPESSMELNDTTQRSFVTSQAASATGDMAYKPLGAGDEGKIPADILNAAYFNEADQLYYYDSEFVSAIYSNEALTSADVKDGKDAAGVPVTPGEDGKYYYTNTVAYTKEWDFVTYDSPWYKDTDVQATDENGNLLYNQIQFNHYNANGNSVRYVDDWVVRIPQSSYQVIPNDGVTEYRGAYTRANDYLQWAIEYVYDHIDTTLAAKLLDEISLVRNGMNTNNFDVLTYNTMVDLAKVVESQYSIDITYNVDEAVIDDEGNTTMGPDGKPVTQTVTKTDTISFGDYNGYMENENIEVTSVAVTSNLSSVQIDEYIRLFNIYMSKVVERGYQGNQLEAEIECASGNTYNNLVATKATYDEESGELLTPAVVTKGASAVEPKFGAWSEDGTLVNEGETVYSAQTWDAYVEALANAVAVAQLGNGSYAHKDVANYNPTAGDYDAQISDCYYTDTALQAAEIALEEDVEEPANEITVSGKVMIATDLAGTSYTTGIVGIDVYAGDQLVATSAEDGSFTATVPVGTTELTFKGSTTIDRTVTLSGTADITGAIVPIVICDYNTDGSVNATDYAVLSLAYGAEYNVYCDLNGDDIVNATDYAAFSVFYGQKVVYDALALD